MKSYTSFVNVFQGNGEINLPKPEGIASTWFFVKAQCGNTFPHAALPFSKMTCGAYSGAYPTGYGTHDANYCGKVGKIYDEKCFCGFSHIHHSGTGAVGYYYNYALTAPFTGSLEDAFSMQKLTGEKAFPGYYSAIKGRDNILCEATVTKRGSALHRYTFSGDGGRIAVDFNNGGLLTNGMRSYAEHGRIEVISENEACATVCMEGVKLCFSVICKGAKSSALFCDCNKSEKRVCEYKNKHIGRYGVCFETDKKAIITLSYSLVSTDRAKNLSHEDAVLDFDEAVCEADEIWNKYLSAIDIEADDKTKEIFYSNMYHTIIKPANLNGESFIYGEGRAFFTDFTTLWDIYKTQLPLVFSLYRKEGREISETLVRVFEALGYSPNCLTISDRYGTESNQARALTTLVLTTAHICGCDGLPLPRIFEAVYGDIMSERNRDFIEGKTCKLYTHILDLSDACFSAALLADELGDTEKAETLRRLSENYVTAYDSNTGLLSDKSEYYEGGLHNYSFRLCHDMNGRIKLAGGKERFAALLDSFFGYGKPQVKQPESDDKEYISSGIKLGRFEGFNNEPDMEAPYSYIYAGRRDRLCEVIHAGIKYMFTYGEGGIPGNNDSGGLSSCCIWNMLGIFPEAGRDRMLIGSPSVKRATLRLSSGKEFEIKVIGEGFYVEKAFLNGKAIDEMYFCMSDMMKGGVLEVCMSRKPASE